MIKNESDAMLLDGASGSGYAAGGSSGCEDETFL